MIFTLASIINQRQKENWKLVNASHLNLAISLSGPPIPHPTSNTWNLDKVILHSLKKMQKISQSLYGKPQTLYPGFKSNCKARKCSCLLMLSRRDSPFHLEWKICTFRFEIEKNRDTFWSVECRRRKIVRHT